MRFLNTAWGWRKRCPNPECHGYIEDDIYPDGDPLWVRSGCCPFCAGKQTMVLCRPVFAGRWWNPLTWADYRWETK